MLVSKVYQPRSIKKVNNPKSCLINEKPVPIQTKQLTFAVGAGGVPRQEMTSHLHLKNRFLKKH